MTFNSDQTGGLAAVLAHPDDESFACAGAFALAHDAGRLVRLLLLTRGEAGTPDGTPDLEVAETREEEMRCAAGKIGMSEVTVVDHPDGRLVGHLLDPGRRDRGLAGRPTA